MTAAADPSSSSRLPGPILDSGLRADTPWNRWSYQAGPASLWLRCDGGTGIASLCDAHGILRTWSEPLAALRWMGQSLAQPPRPGPPFKGGWIGWLGYDLGRRFETLPFHAADDLHWPLFEFTFHDQVRAKDGLTGGETHLRLPGEPAAAYLAFPERHELSHAPPQSNFTRRGYEAAVARALDYIAGGDIFQVNLSQRFTAGLREEPGHIYQRLRGQSPAWFGAYLDYGDRALLCNSPELFWRLTPDPATGERHILTRPIKGTRPRGRGMDTELRHSIKDQAELNMIVDLERNDLGRICRIGSVRVTEARTIESHPTVYHGAATVEGLLRDDVDLVEILRALFPGGSITGAPKIRAMQIIDELEPTRRGPYCGAIGYLSVDGHMQFNIAIRTMIVGGGQVHIPVGGGIVADSTPEGEYHETLVKARALFTAMGLPTDDIGCPQP